MRDREKEAIEIFESIVYRKLHTDSFAKIYDSPKN